MGATPSRHLKAAHGAVQIAILEALSKGPMTSSQMALATGYGLASIMKATKRLSARKLVFRTKGIVPFVWNKKALWKA